MRERFLGIVLIALGLTYAVACGKTAREEPARAQGGDTIAADIMDTTTPDMPPVAGGTNETAAAETTTDAAPPVVAQRPPTQRPPVNPAPAPAPQRPTPETRPAPATGQSAEVALRERQRAIEQVQVRLDAAPRDPARQRELDEVILQTFDFDRLARESLGQHWTKMTADQQEEYLRLFRQLVARSTANKLKAYRASGTRYTNIQQTGNEAVILTVATSKNGESAAIEYKLHRKDGRWWIWDTRIGLDAEITEYDVSTAQNYRSSFNRIVRQNGIPGLLDRLRQKATSGGEL